MGRGWQDTYEAEMLVLSDGHYSEGATATVQVPLQANSPFAYSSRVFFARLSATSRSRMPHLLIADRVAN